MRLAGFQALHDHFDTMPYHGELVAFGTLVQLVMEERESGLVDEVRAFCTNVGLPTTFDQLGLRSSPTDDMLLLVADGAAKSGTIAAMPKAHDMPDANFNFYDPKEIADCIRKTDALGRS